MMYLGLYSLLNMGGQPQHQAATAVAGLAAGASLCCLRCARVVMSEGSSATTGSSMPSKIELLTKQVYGKEVPCT